MASPMCVLTSGHMLCPCCHLVPKNPRILTQCQHTFCLHCIEILLSKNYVKCPLCQIMTAIPPGLQPRHLPSKSETNYTRRGITEIKIWRMDKPVYAVTFDEKEKVLYVATGDENSPLQLYNYQGEYTGYLPVTCVRIALDIKRGLLLTIGGKWNYFLLYNKRGSKVGEVASAKFRAIVDIAYHVDMDMYIVADANCNCIYYVDPKTKAIMKKLDKKEVCTVLSKLGEIVNSYISCSTTSRQTLWATSDRDKNLVKLYDTTGDVVYRYGGTSCRGEKKKLTNPSRACIDQYGRVLLCDSGNRRVVRIDPAKIGHEEELHLVINTQEFGLPKPRAIDVTADGYLAITACHDLWNGPFYVGLFSGLK